MVRNVPHFPRATPEEAVSTSKPKYLPIRTITHNIRYAATDLDENERPWPYRCPILCQELLYHTRFLDGGQPSQWTTSSAAASTSGASFICLQEVLHGQLCDILCGLNRIDEHDGATVPNGPYWSYVGIGRDDGKTEGEYSPVIYPTRLFELLHFENTWLSPTPDRPSKGWDAGNKRILTTAVLQHRVTKQRLGVFNTHLDNEGSESRAKSVPIILSVIDRVRKEWDVAQLSGASGLAFILAGDFNSRPGMEAYQAMVASGAAVDALRLVPEEARYGDEDTFSGFTPKPDIGKGNRRIDFLWFGPKSRVATEESTRKDEGSFQWCIEGYSTIPNVFSDGIFCSDHRAVVVDAVLCSY